MSQAADLLVRLSGLGVKLEARDGRLSFQAPKGVMTSELLAQTRACKSELLALLGGGAAPRAAAVPRAPRDRPIPLSFAQERLWFLDRLLERESASAYHMPTAMRLEGSLDVLALERALGEIERRHEILRTRFVARDDRPIQAIDPFRPRPLPVVELDGLAPAEGEALGRALAEREANRPFDLARGPVHRAVLLRLGGGERVLLQTVHHIVSDGWSIGVMAKELAAGYAAFVRGGQPQAPSLPVQFADYALWQRSRQAELQNQIDYWVRKLDGAPSLLELPHDRPRPPVQTFRGDFVVIRWPPALTERLKAVGRRAQATLFMTLQAGLALLLSRYSGQAETVVGAPTAGRPLKELEPLIGMFLNTVALRCDLAGDPDFETFLGRVKQTALEAFRNDEAPFERVVEILQPERNLSHGPLFQIMFALQNAPLDAFSPPGLALSFMDKTLVSTKFDLTLSMMETEAGLRGHLEYNADLFDKGTAARMARHFERLLRDVVEDPTRPVSRYRLLDPAERERLVHEWNDTETPYAADVCLHELFEAQARRTPERPAAYCRGAALSYAALNRRANRLARRLRETGVGPGDLVGVCFERSFETLVGLYAVLKAGAAYVPIDPAFPRDRAAYILASASSPLLLTQRAIGEAWSDIDIPRVYLDEDDSPGYAETDPPNRATADCLAYIIFTSGSTGAPKGVVLQHRPVVNLIEWVNKTYRVGPGDRLLFVTSLCFDLSVYDIFGMLACGGAVTIPTEDEVKDPEALVGLLRGGGVTFWDSAPAALLRLTPFLPAAGEGGPDLRLVFLSGDWVPLTLPPAIVAAFPNARVIALGGATEAAIWSNFFPVREIRPEWRSVPYGNPIQNARYHTLDRVLEPQPPGVIGNLYIGGKCLSSGYFQQPGLTAERYVPDPFADEPGARLYDTGDRARWLARGYIEFMGRRDAQVKLRGFRIELGEIEAVLQKHERVREAVALVRATAGGDQRLIGYLLLAGGDALDEALAAELRALIRKKLPEYMTPGAFVAVAAWPLTANGKLDRDALPEPAAAAEAATDGGDAAYTPTQQILAGMWAEALERPWIGLDENFFEAGGHSLMAAQLVARMRQTFETALTLQQMFAAPTVAGMAALIEAGDRAAAAPPPEPRGGDGPAPLSFAQQRLWFLDQLEGGAAVFTVPAFLDLDGALRVDLLADAFAEILRRHEVLRAYFPLAGDAPVQRVAPPGPAPLTVVDLRPLPADARRGHALAAAVRLAETPFDLAVGPPLRMALFRLGSERWTLALTVHQIAFDGWSIALFLREWTAVYGALLAGRPSPLSDLPFQYADFAVWQRSLFDGDALAPQLRYWREKLAGAPAALALPLDRERPDRQTAVGGVVKFRVEPELRRALETLGRRLGATLFMTALAAYKLLLRHYAGQTDIVVGSPIANRPRVELEPLIGFFPGTLALRTDLAGDPTFEALVGRVRDTALGAYARQDVPFERLVQELRLDRDLSRRPLIQTWFTLQNLPSAALSLPGLSLRAIELDETERVAVQFDIETFLWAEDEALGGSFKYNLDLFKRETVARMARRYRALLGRIAAAPDARLSDLVGDWAAEDRQALESRAEALAQNERAALRRIRRGRRGVAVKPG